MNEGPACNLVSPVSLLSVVHLITHSVAKKKKRLPITNRIYQISEKLLAIDVIFSSFFFYYSSFDWFVLLLLF